jgi:hypothetical protein
MSTSKAAFLAEMLFFAGNVSFLSLSPSKTVFWLVYDLGMRKATVHILPSLPAATRQVNALQPAALVTYSSPRSVIPVRFLVPNPGAQDGVALIRQPNLLPKHLRAPAVADIEATTPNNTVQIIMITALAAVLSSVAVVVTTHLLHGGNKSMLASSPMPPAPAALMVPAQRTPNPTTAGEAIATAIPPPTATRVAIREVMVPASVINKPAAAMVTPAPVASVNTKVPPPRVAVVTAVAPKALQVPVAVAAPTIQQTTTSMPASSNLPPPMVREVSPILAKRPAVGASAIIPYVTIKRADAGVEALDVNRVVIASKETGAPISYALGNMIPGMGVLKMIDPATSTIITDTTAIRLID